MGLYFPNLDIPKSCGECPCRNRSNDICQITNERLISDPIVLYNMRSKSCPAKSIDEYIMNVSFPIEEHTTTGIQRKAITIQMWNP